MSRFLKAGDFKAKILDWLKSDTEFLELQEGEYEELKEMPFFYSDSTFFPEGFLLLRKGGDQTPVYADIYDDKGVWTLQKSDGRL